MPSIFLSHSILFCQSFSLTIFLSNSVVSLLRCECFSLSHSLLFCPSFFSPFLCHSCLTMSCQWFNSLWFCQLFIFSVCLPRSCAVHLPLSPWFWQSLSSHVLSGSCCIHIVLSSLAHSLTHSLTHSLFFCQYFSLAFSLSMVLSQFLCCQCFSLTFVLSFLFLSLIIRSLLLFHSCSVSSFVFNYYCCLSLVLSIFSHFCYVSPSLSPFLCNFCCRTVVL